jgi:hypothetical protein
MNLEWNPIEIEYEKIVQNNNLLEKIITGESPALIIRNFYNGDSCKTISKRVEIKTFEHDEKIKKIGVSLVSFISKKSEYFIQAEKLRKTVRQVFSGLEDPRKKIHNTLEVLFPEKQVTIASENGKKYACGVIRLHQFGDSAPIHRDNVSFEARSFDVSKFPVQLSTVLYIQQSQKGGELVLHKKSWKKSDEKFRNLDFGYSKNVISDCNLSVKIKPNQGDLLIINPNYYHEILPVRANRRITLGLFLAFSKHGEKVVTWS